LKDGVLKLKKKKKGVQAPRNRRQSLHRGQHKPERDIGV